MRDLNGVYSSKELRQNLKLLRNDFRSEGMWDMPVIRKCEVDITGIELLASDHVKITENTADILKTVHFFVDDIKLDRYYNDPDRYLSRLAQYPHLLTPDYSLYTDMPMAIQIYNTFKSRWCGAFWQENRLSVIPTVSWSTIDSFKFCFDGIEPGSVVAISSLGGLTEKSLFLRGYFELIERIGPAQILCFGKGFTEMGTEVITVDYLKTTRRKK